MLGLVCFAVRFLTINGNAILFRPCWIFHIDQMDGGDGGDVEYNRCVYLKCRLLLKPYSVQNGKWCWGAHIHKKTPGISPIDTQHSMQMIIHQQWRIESTNFGFDEIHRLMCQISRLNSSSLSLSSIFDVSSTHRTMPSTIYVFQNGTIIVE